MDKVDIVADCCHAEGISRELGVMVKAILTPEKGVKLPPKREKPSNILEIAACLSHELAFELVIDGKRQGVFTYNLCKILRANPNISLEDLQQLLRNRIRRQTPVITPLQGYLFRRN